MGETMEKGRFKVNALTLLLLSVVATAQGSLPESVDNIPEHWKTCSWCRAMGLGVEAVEGGTNPYYPSVTTCEWCDDCQKWRYHTPPEWRYYH